MVYSSIKPFWFLKLHSKTNRQLEEYKDSDFLLHFVWIFSLEKTDRGKGRKPLLWCILLLAVFVFDVAFKNKSAVRRIKGLRFLATLCLDFFSGKKQTTVIARNLSCAVFF